MRRTVLALSAILGALLLPLVGAAGAGISRPDFDYDPKSGPAGTVITASGDCSIFQPNGAADAEGPALPAGSGLTATVELSDPSGVLATATVDQDPVLGTWEAQLTVPEGTPPGDYDLDAWCTFAPVNTGRPAGLDPDGVDRPAGSLVFPYATQTFTVTAQPGSTSTTTSTSSTEGPTSTTRPAAAAQAVRAAPSFTG